MQKKKLALFDIDDTLYKGPSTFHFAKYLVEKNVIEVDVLHVIKTDIEIYRAGIIDYSNIITNILKHFAESLTGKHEKEIYTLANKFFSEDDNYYYDFTKSLLEVLHTEYDLYLVSSAPFFIAQAIMDFFDCYIKGCYGTEYAVKDHVFLGDIATQMDKENITKELLTLYGFSDSFAFGDSIDDIKMLKHVQNPICFNPKEDMKEHAQQQSWKIATEENIVDEVSKLLKL